ncbi:MAG: YjjG family noncanonical pyrimidine nucleotidase [Chitinophagaceae bacterium]|nr:YjjG family noncanonical pyrimidine nucleotidase [Chitinophagaceae bacterium]
MQTKPYKHLFFDLDHTIWDFETNAKDTLNDLFLQFKLQEKGIDCFDSFFTKYSHYNHMLWDRYTKGFIKQQELRWKRMWLALLDYKIADEALSKNMAVAFTDILPLKKNLFPHTHELLTYLQGKQYQMHLITNGFDSIQYKKLEQSNLQQYFTEVITSEASNSLKPHKEIFHYALEKTKANLVESIMIGDNVEADIEGALNVNMDTIYVNHLNTNKYERSKYTVFHLNEIEGIL